WGDNHISTGLVINDPTTPGVFLVMARNTYAADGTYPVQVTITDRGGSVAVAQSTAVVGSGGGPGSHTFASKPPTPPPVSPPTLPPALTMHNGILKVVAAPGVVVQVEFRVLLRLASFRNELGLIFLDAHRRINGLNPASPGFLRQALRSPHR